MQIFQGKGFQEDGIASVKYLREDRKKFQGAEVS